MQKLDHLDILNDGVMEPIATTASGIDNEFPLSGVLILRKIFHGTGQMHATSIRHMQLNHFNESINEPRACWLVMFHVLHYVVEAIRTVAN